MSNTVKEIEILTADDAEGVGRVERQRNPKFTEVLHQDCVYGE